MSDSDLQEPDYLVIGYITEDEAGHRYVPGGSVYYGSVTALRLGLKASVVTSCEENFPIPKDMADSNVEVVPSKVTTRFRNEYQSKSGYSVRKQYVGNLANEIRLADVPLHWQTVPLVHLGPLMGEISKDIAEAFPQSLVIASIQGWIRELNPDGEVVRKYWEGSDVLTQVDIAICSKEDSHSNSDIERWASMVPLFIVTDGSRGVTVFDAGSESRIEAISVKEIDPTGAGDVFAAAFLIRFSETTDPIESATFASIAAGISVSARGVQAIPDKKAIESLRANL